MVYEYYKKFITSIPSENKGFVALINMADFKRRNCYLDYQICDQDIVDLENIFAKIPEILYSRIDGDEWVVYCENDPEFYLNKICDLFGNTLKAVFFIRYILHFSDKTIKEYIVYKEDVCISRGIRIVFKHLDINESKQEVSNMHDVLRYHVAKVGIPYNFETCVSVIDAERHWWKCFEDENIYEKYPKSCLNCNMPIIIDEADSINNFGECCNCTARFTITPAVEIVYPVIHCPYPIAK
jgi:hypothetical protein